MFFSEQLPNSLVFSSEEVLKGQIINEGYVFYNYARYKDRFNNIFYAPNAKRVNDVKKNVQLIDIYILENYATDKYGNKL